MPLNLLTEILPINEDNLPIFYCYQIQLSSNTKLEEICRPLQYRMKLKFQGCWVWSKSDQLMLSNIQISAKEINDILTQLWEDKSNTIFQQYLEGITFKPESQVSQQGIADFYSQGLLVKYDNQIAKILQPSRKDRDKYYIRLVHYFNSWVVSKKAAVSISLKQEIDYKETLGKYLKRKPDTSKILGLHVLDRTKPFFKSSQEIIEIVGLLGEGNRRQRLLSQTQHQKMKEMLLIAPDDELVVKIGKKKKGYDYIVSALKIRVLNQDYARLGISERLQIVSEERIEYLQPIFELIQSDGLLKKVYFSFSERNPDMFIFPSKEWGYSPRFMFGNNNSINSEDILDTVSSLKKYGEFKKSTNSTIRISILNCIQNDGLNVWLKAFKDQLKTHFNPNFENNKNLLKYALKLEEEKDYDLKKSKIQLEKVIRGLAEKSPNIVLCLLPNILPSHDSQGRTAYDDLKQLFLKYNLQSQMIREKTLTDSYATKNIILGIIAKNGSIPYILGDKLEYTDFIVGLDVSRRKKENLSGTKSVAAMTRIYSNQGELIHYSIRDATIDGEIIPEHILYDLFPSHEYENKRVVIHRDGNFPEEERQILEQIANEINSTFYFVSVIKSGNPRMYGHSSKTNFCKAQKGSIFLLDSDQALLISSDFPDRFKATPQPLRIQIFGNFSLKNAVHSVLSLTYLHYGSERPPRLPVSTEYADKISTMVSKGIKPQDIDGNIPFWL